MTDDNKLSMYSARVAKLKNAEQNKSSRADRIKEPIYEGKGVALEDVRRAVKEQLKEHSP